MRHAKLLGLLSGLALAATGCNFDRIDGAVEIDVTGVPADAIRVQLNIIDSNGSKVTRNPHFGPGVYTGNVLVLTVPPFTTGNFTVTVNAYDDNNFDNNDQDNDLPIATGSGAGNYQPATSADQPIPVVNVALVSTGFQGNYGTPCFLTGTGTNACNSNLVCAQYTSTDQGVCTLPCNGNQGCSSSPAGATCQPYKGDSSTTYCQWDCTNGEPCPSGLVCGNAIPNTGGKKFCQGTAP